jgi:hypothetical protein
MQKKQLFAQELCHQLLLSYIILHEWYRPWLSTDSPPSLSLSLSLISVSLCTFCFSCISFSLLKSLFLWSRISLLPAVLIACVFYPLRHFPFFLFLFCNLPLLSQSLPPFPLPKLGRTAEYKIKYKPRIYFPYPHRICISVRPSRSSRISYWQRE